MQHLQRVLHRVMFEPVLTGRRVGPPTQLVLLARYAPGFPLLLSRLIAFGPLPEHAPAFARRDA
ncbi:hypothetical protein ACIRRH_07540 [Kitasatospora sp. NPDC101235]|uniref:hypothetical protein n=1 Tax=Kitasatospora sp. NPDC101235 TaxID=3364101 RepID=UPI003806B9C6